jgi:hypothetical protein
VLLTNSTSYRLCGCRTERRGRAGSWTELGEGGDRSERESEQLGVLHRNRLWFECRLV